MIVIGLTGSIGMGKTTTAQQFSRLGIPVLDSDLIVHLLMRHDKTAIGEIGKHFPAAIQNKAVDRAILSREVFGKPEQLAILERILHPRVRAAQDQFIRQHTRRRTRAVILDIPLLFETKGERRCDLVVVASAPAFLQAQRVMKRDGMTTEKLTRILKRQMPDAEKRKHADHVVRTGLGKRESLKQVARIIRRLRQHHRL